MRALVLGAACCLASSALIAQRAPARIDGVVTDSVHSAALPGALVLLARRTMDTTISSSTTTDDKGRFSFHDLPPGQYVVALESSFLDSLEIALPPSVVMLSAGERRRIDLAIPSGATLRNLTCPGVLLPAGIGALAGRVWDASDEKPLHGVELQVGWSETSVDRATLRATNVEQRVEVRSDSLGRFRVCGVPTDTYLDLHAKRDAFQELVLQVVVPDDAGVARQNVSLQPTQQATRTITRADTTAPTIHAGAVATLVGIVYGATAPLARVQLQRRGDPAVVSTDSLGRYRFSAVPIGTQVLEVRRVGYLPRQLTIQVRPGDNRAPELHLTPVTTLDSIRVVAQRPRYREFERRAKVASFGRFLRAEDIAKKRPLLTSDLLRQMPGFRVVRTSTSDLDVGIVATSGPVSLSNNITCNVKIIIDGVPNQKINWIEPYSIGAMEIYPGTNTGPVQYQSPCGTILIWTKRY